KFDPTALSKSFRLNSREKAQATNFHPHKAAASKVTPGDRAASLVSLPALVAWAVLLRGRNSVVAVAIPASGQSKTLSMSPCLESAKTLFALDAIRLILPRQNSAANAEYRLAPGTCNGRRQSRSNYFAAPAAPATPRIQDFAANEEPDSARTEHHD